MIDDKIERIVAAQEALLAALDSRSAEAIEAASGRLAEAVADAKSSKSMTTGAANRDAIGLALQQNDAAKTRVAYLAGLTASRSARLSEARGQTSAFRYARP